MKSLRIAINGFGRIGRTFLRILMNDPEILKKLNVVAINLGPKRPERLDLLFKYDTLMRQYPGDVKVFDDKLVVDGHEIKLLAESDPKNLPWGDLKIDWVIESSGKFTSGEGAALHVQAGCKNVLITAPSTGEDFTVIPGVNDDGYDASKHHIVSLGSCTTNCFAPVVKVLHETFGLTSGLMTTTHAYTNDQVLLDVEHKDPRRARAAACNMVPTKTGADKVIVKVFPDLAGKIQATAIRVPVPLVSIVDFTFTASKTMTKDLINKAFENYAASKLKNILKYSTEPLVSSDFIGDSHSAIFDSLMTLCDGHQGKVFAWYDNEYGYSCRLKDFLLHNI